MNNLMCAILRGVVRCGAYIISFALIAPVCVFANVPAGSFQFNGSFYFYNGGVPGNNSYCLFATPPANSSTLPVMDPQSIPGAVSAGMCGGGSPPALDFTYTGNFYFYNGGAPGNNSYCLQRSVPPNAANFPVLNPQSIPAAVSAGTCRG